jgi:hypothetical protein
MDNYLYRKINNTLEMHDFQEKTENKPAIISPPPKLVLLTLSGLIFLCWIAGSGLVFMACEQQGIDLQGALAGFGKNGTLEERNFVRGALLINHTATFLLPALITNWIFFKNEWQQKLALNNPLDLRTLGLSVLFMMAAFPIAQEAFLANRWLVEQIPSLRSLVETETATENMMEGLLVMQSPWELLFSLLVMGIVPAIGEELVFRGTVQKQIEKWTSRPLLTIGLTAFLFSLVHFQIQRFLAILWLGLVLGLLLFWTKNLWIPIAAHFLNNGAQVVVAYFNQEKLNDLNQGVGEELPLSLLLASAGLIVLAGFQLWKNSVKPSAIPPL